MGWRAGQQGWGREGSSSTDSGMSNCSKKITAVIILSAWVGLKVFGHKHAVI